jgi:recombinational DNA repair protein (RecF pathway)
VSLGILLESFGFNPDLHAPDATGQVLPVYQAQNAAGRIGCEYHSAALIDIQS